MIVVFVVSVVAVLTGIDAASCSSFVLISQEEAEKRARVASSNNNLVLIEWHPSTLVTWRRDWPVDAFLDRVLPTLPRLSALRLPPRALSSMALAALPRLRSLEIRELEFDDERLTELPLALLLCTQIESLLLSGHHPRLRITPDVLGCLALREIRFSEPRSRREVHQQYHAIRIRLAELRSLPRWLPEAHHLLPLGLRVRIATLMYVWSLFPDSLLGRLPYEMLEECFSCLLATVPAYPAYLIIER